MNKELLIAETASVKAALKKLDKTALKLLLVAGVDNTLLGALSDGDLRRAFLSGAGLDESIEKYYNHNPFALLQGEYSEEMVREAFLEKKIELIPIVNRENAIVDVLCWNDVFKGTRKVSYDGPPLTAPVVIMAGGKGTRLAPFTNILPKPLIPIGDKTILELIIDEFKIYGSRKFWLSLNYRKEIIKAYLEGIEKGYEIEYMEEDDFYGTAGGLSYLKGKLNETFIVTNCDIIVKACYPDLVKLHKRSGAILTMVSAFQHHVVPYGVVEFMPGGNVTKIREKPEYSYTINTGVYVLEPECLDLIPKGQVFHMTHLIEALLAKGRTVVTYPINEGEYIDIGQWDEYKRATRLLL